MSHLTDSEGESALAQPPMKRKALSKEDAEGLKEVFGVNDRDMEEAMRGPQSSTPSHSNTVLHMLAEAIRKSGNTPSS